MRPELSAAIYAARELAWQPTHNLSSKQRYDERNAAHQRLVDALSKFVSIYAETPEVSFLWAAMLRVAACSFANRKGLAYYERKQAVAELRGCLLAYDRAREVAA